MATGLDVWYTYTMDETTIKVIIAGCGALGSVFGAGLINSGVELQVYQRRGATFDALKEQGGIKLVTTEGQAPELFPFSRISDDPGELEQADLILVLVKAYSTGELEVLKRSLRQGGAVLSLQNGMGNAEILAEFFGQERVAAGVATYGAYTLSPGTVQAAGPGIVSLGPWSYGSDFSWITEVLQRAGFQTEYVDDPRPYLWRKLAVNAMVNTVAALCRVKNGMLRENRYTLRLMRHLGEETVEAARRAGVVVDFDKLWQFFMENLRKTAGNRPSMLQDVESGRQTEIDGISGAVLKYAEADDDFPYTRAIYSLIKGIDTMLPS